MQGLVLSGGGAKGAYQVGVVKALEELGYEYQCITGTSIGAINGAFIATGQVEVLYDLWSELELTDLIAGNTELLHKLIKYDFRAKDIRQLMKSFKGVVADNGLDTTPFKNLIQKYITEEKIRNAPIDLGMVTVSLTDIKPLEVFKDEIPNGLIMDYLIASANLPIFKLNRLEGKLFIDGGFYDNLPINLMASKGVRDMVVVDLGAIGIVRKPENQDLNIRSICPSEDVGLLLEITPKKAKRNLKMGYYDAMRVFNRYQGNQYYLLPQYQDERTKSYFWNKDIEVNAFEAYLPIRGMDPKRALFEKVLPFFAELLKLESQTSYFGICVSILEAKASELKIDRLKPYGYRELASKIENKQKYQLLEPVIFPVYTMGRTSALMTKKQKQTLLQLGWEIVKGVFLDEGL